MDEIPGLKFKEIHRTPFVSLFTQIDLIDSRAVSVLRLLTNLSLYKIPAGLNIAFLKVNVLDFPEPAAKFDTAGLGNK